jgi:aminotransferase
MNKSEHQFFEDRVSHNVSGIKISAIKEMAILSAKIKDAASLTWGVPSFRTPEYIRNGVLQLLDQDAEIGKYTLPDGLKELRQVVARQHLADTGVKVDPDENIMITAGNMQAFNTLFRVISDPRDEIILTDPCFASHIQQVRMCGCEPVYWPLDEKNNWSLAVESLPKFINKKTKAIVIVSPSNPTGKIFRKDELNRIGEIAKQYGIMVLIDDPYHHFSYENRGKYYNLASNKELFDHIIYSFTFSKSYAMSGWRLGYTILPGHLKKQALKVHDATMICAPRISQVAGFIALSQKSDHIAEFEAELAKRRELICQRLDNVPHVFEYIKPEGAYYVFPRIVAEHSNAYDFSIKLLNEAKVAVTPGNAFGPSGEHHVRMAYCVPEDMINLAFDRIEKYFK